MSQKQVQRFWYKLINIIEYVMTDTSVWMLELDWLMETEFPQALIQLSTNWISTIHHNHLQMIHNSNEKSLIYRGNHNALDSDSDAAPGRKSIKPGKTHHTKSGGSEDYTVNINQRPTIPRDHLHQGHVLQWSCMMQIMPEDRKEMENLGSFS